jgi:hypothetical protein
VGWAFVVSPTYVRAHLFSGDVSERVIKRLDVLGLYSNRMADPQALAFVYNEDGSGVREVLSVRCVRKWGLQDRGRTMSGLSIWSAPEFWPKMLGVGGLWNLFRSEFA